MHVKICGLLTPDDAIACVELGASAIGVNLVSASKRCVSIDRAKEISRAIGSRALVVGVVADMSIDEMKRAKHEAELGCLQLHGDEPPESITALLPHAYRAIRVATAADVARAAEFPGDHLLVDAKVVGSPGTELEFAL